MKAKSLLLSAVALLTASGAYAQNDITPDRFKFANQPEGEYKIDYFVKTANPANGWQIPIDRSDDGFLMVAGAPAGIPATEEIPSTNMGQSIQKLTTIVDLGGEVGKVLCMKGKSSKYEKGAENIPDADIRWFNYNFYTPFTFTPISTSEDDQNPIRVRLVFSIVHNTQTSTDEMFKMYASTLANSPTPVNGLFSAADFQLLDEEGDPVVDDEWNAQYDPTKWMVYEFDFVVGTEAGNPARLKMEIANAIWAEGAILIKELKFMTEPVGDPIQREYVTYKPGDASVADLLKDDAFTVSGDQVTFSAAGEVYGLNGMKVATAKAGETVQLNAGFYIVRANGESSKLIIK